MFGQLFIKECRQTAKSLIYYIFILCVAFFYFTQMGNMTIDGKPKEGLESYGVKKSNDESLMMQATLQSLVSEYYENDYTTYPIGFAKHVKPSEEERIRLSEIVSETTGLTDEQIEALFKKAGEEAQNSPNHMFIPPEIKPVSGLSFDAFEKRMAEVDEMLGGGSSYGAEEIRSSATTAKTYEDALAEYHELVEKDGFTGGFARLFCDYMGIVLGLLPVFVAVTRGLRDRRSGMRELIASRRCNSASIVVSRYLAMVFMMFLPVLIISVFPLMQCIFFAGQNQISVDYFAFVVYSLGWLLPSILFTSAVGVFITELTDSALAVIFMGIGWFWAISSGVSRIHGGDYGWNLIARHNTEYNYSGFIEDFSQLAANRILYTALAVLMVTITILIYSKKRKGSLDIHGKIFGSRKRTSEV